MGILVFVEWINILTHKWNGYILDMVLRRRKNTWHNQEPLAQALTKDYSRWKQNLQEHFSNLSTNWLELMVDNDTMPTDTYLLFIFWVLSDNNSSFCQPLILLYMYPSK